MANDFQNLEQGDMIVAEYATKFLHLSQYNPHSVLNDKERAYKFKMGLHMDILGKIIRFTGMADVMD